MKLLSSAALLFGVLALVACAPAAEEVVFEEPDIEQDDHAIRALLTQATEANNQEDADAWADLFTDDAVLMPQGGPAIQGRDALLASEKALNDQFDARITITPIEIVVTGEWAFARTEVKGSRTPAEGGEPSVVDAKELLILRRQRDRSWRVHRLIGNANTPSVPWHAARESL